MKVQVPFTYTSDENDFDTIPPSYGDIEPQVTRPSATCENDDVTKPYGDTEPQVTQPSATPVRFKRVFNLRKALTLFCTVVFLALVIVTSVSLATRDKSFAGECVYTYDDMFGPAIWTAVDNVVYWMVLFLIHITWLYSIAITNLWISWEHFEMYFLFTTCVFILEAIPFGFQVVQSQNRQCFRENPAFAAWMTFSLFPWIIGGFILVVFLLYTLGRLVKYLGYLMKNYLIPFDLVQ